MGRNEAEEKLEQSVGKIVNVNCLLEDGVSEYQKMMYAGILGEAQQHYFVRRYEKYVDGGEEFSGLWVSSNGGLINLKEDDYFTLYNVPEIWPGDILLLDADDFQKAKSLCGDWLNMNSANVGDKEEV